MRSLCARLGVPLTVERVELAPDAPGNLQERARDARYALAERLAEGDYARGPHRVRPGRDGALPAGGVTRLAGAARDAARGAGGSCGRCWG